MIESKTDIYNKVLSTTYKQRINDCAYIARERNDILHHLHGKIPSYAVWDDQSVAMESLEDRLKWFTDITKNMHYSKISERVIGPSCDEND